MDEEIGLDKQQTDKYEREASRKVVSNWLVKR